jgi:hypothetical protein
LGSLLTPPPSSLFAQAIELDPNNHVLYSNRSACYASIKDFDGALKDAIKTTGMSLIQCMGSRTTADLMVCRIEAGLG